MFKKTFFYFFLAATLIVLLAIVFLLSYSWKNHVKPGSVIAELIKSLLWNARENGQSPASSLPLADTDFLKFIKPAVIEEGLSKPLSGEMVSSDFNDLNICLATDFFSHASPDYFRDNKYYNYAIIKMLVDRDNNDCTKYPKESMENCKSLYYKLLSLKDYSNKVVVNLTDDTKLIILALIEGKAEHCDRVNDQYDKKLCLAMAAGDPGLCTFDKSVNAADCVKNEKGDDVIGCKLDAEKADKRCRSTVYLSKASKSSDVSVCDMISDRFMREYCIVLNMEYDYKLKVEANDFFHNNFCYEKYALDAAVEKKDVTLCEKIPQKDFDNKIMYEQCLSNFSKD